jgi:hypothetical protein
MVYRDEKKMHEILGQGRLLEYKWVSSNGYVV